MYVVQSQLIGCEVDYTYVGMCVLPLLACCCPKPVQSVSRWSRRVEKWIQSCYCIPCVYIDRYIPVNLRCSQLDRKHCKSPLVRSLFLIALTQQQVVSRRRKDKWGKHQDREARRNSNSNSNINNNSWAELEGESTRRWQQQALRLLQMRSR